MKCLVCQSEDTTYIETIMTNEGIGHEVYTCTDCKSSSEYGIIVQRFIYTGKNNVYPFEE